MMEKAKKRSQAQKIRGVMCTVPDCPGVAPPAEGCPPRPVACRRCGARHCGRSLCGSPWTEGHRCWDIVEDERRRAEMKDPLLATRRRLANAPRFRPCPTCSVMVEHVDGCNMVFHEACRTRWCFACRRIGTCSDFECRAPGSGPPTPRPRATSSTAGAAAAGPRKVTKHSRVVVSVGIVCVAVYAWITLRIGVPRNGFLLAAGSPGRALEALESIGMSSATFESLVSSKPRRLAASPEPSGDVVSSELEEMMIVSATDLPEGSVTATAGHTAADVADAQSQTSSSPQGSFLTAGSVAADVVALAPSAEVAAPLAAVAPEGPVVNTEPPATEPLSDSSPKPHAAVHSRLRAESSKSPMHTEDVASGLRTEGLVGPGRDVLSEAPDASAPAAADEVVDPALQEHPGPVAPAEPSADTRPLEPVSVAESPHVVDEPAQPQTSDNGAVVARTEDPGLPDAAERRSGAALVRADATEREPCQPPCLPIPQASRGARREEHAAAANGSEGGEAGRPAAAAAAVATSDDESRRKQVATAAFTCESASCSLREVEAAPAPEPLETRANEGLAEAGPVRPDETAL
eukprot:TRINITY_DN4784_c1_g1_i1.p1 TRINITY_DN4784_c1_g1~~TRINITY_DN4784_c1_g1_i1.p1  ORF type:complete len:577 (-),score=91.01 TRINITY_DN4784_c1_g1_i1:118-1848(-)